MLDSYIGGAESIVDDLQIVLEKITSHADIVSDFNLNNSEWRKFADGTIVGRRLENDLTVICNLLRTELPVYVNDISTATRAFLEEQRRINSQTEV